MPWFNDIDETRPTDLEFVSEGAERFRELKRALIERLETAYKGFPGENPDRAGETLLFPIASVRVGTEAQRPATPEREGAGWFSTDSGILYISDRNLQWRSTQAGTFVPALPMMRASKQLQEQTFTSPETTGELIEFDGADISYQDNGAFFDANQSRVDFVIPESGRYHISASIGLSALTAPSLTQSSIMINDVQKRSAFYFLSTGLVSVIPLSMQIGLNEGDVVNLMTRVFSNIGDVSVMRDDFTALEIARMDRPAVGSPPIVPPEELDYDYDEI